VGGGRADGAEDRGDHQAAQQGHVDHRAVVPLVQVLDELDYADDPENQRYARVAAAADGAALELPVQDEGEGRQGDHDIQDVR
jgi:hypothetical protein